jgi:hypothetical protein
MFNVGVNGRRTGHEVTIKLKIWLDFVPLYQNPQSKSVYVMASNFSWMSVIWFLFHIRYQSLWVPGCQNVTL